MGLDSYMITNSRVLANRFADKMDDKFDVDWCRKYGEILYWRKFSALHNWMVEKIQDGKDDCGIYELNLDDLHHLHDDISKSLETHDAELLPPVEGFFFNPVDYMEYHWEQCERTKKMLEFIFENVNADEEVIGDEGWKVRFYYESSW